MKMRPWAISTSRKRLGGEEFTPEDEVLLLLFAAQAAVAIHNASLHSMVDMERRRLDAILNDAPNGMVYIEKATGQLQANRRAEEMLERSLGPSGSMATATSETGASPWLTLATVLPNLYAW